MPDMTEPAPCRWGAVNVLMRLKNKIREKFFWNRFISDSLDSPTLMATASEPDPRQWTNSQYVDNEASTSNHHNLQHYFDAPQVFQDPSLPQFAVGQFAQDLRSQMLYGEGMMLDPLEGRSTSHDQEAFLTLADLDLDNQQLWTAQMDERGLTYSTPMPVYAEYGCREEYLDARTELQEEQSSVQNNYSTSQLGHLSTVERTEMMDTGDSSNLAPALQPAEWQAHLMFLTQFLEIDGVVRARAGWRVVLGIVSAFKRISGLVRVRRLQRTTSDQTGLHTPRRIKSAEVRSQRYKGIRQRNGKWVSEIRIGGTLEKVWLGSYNTEKEAALAFDAAKHHCSLKKSKFNFSDSPRLLGAPQNLLHLSSIERRTMIQRLAEDHARAFGSADIR